jgi:hypothetical protein
MDLSCISGSEAAYEKFFDECDAMAAGKFILAERHIRSVLIAIAGSSRLLSVFAYAAGGYNFPPEFDRRVAVDGGRKRLALPGAGRDLAAFAYCLLLEIDGRNIDFYKLLNEYFYHADGMADSYGLFCAAVVLPLKTAVRTLRDAATPRAAWEALGKQAAGLRAAAQIPPPMPNL